MSSGDQDSRGFLPPSTTVCTHELHRQPPLTSTTPTVTNPHHLPGFTTLPLPQTTSNDVSCISQESDLAAALDRAIFKIRDAVAAATTVDTRNPIRRTKSDTTSSAYRKHQTRRNPLRRTISDVITSPATGTRKACSSPRSRNTVPESSNREESLRNKAIVEHDEGREECVGFKRLDECDEECIGFNRLDDGALRIQMRCSCRKHFEILHNHIGCFYRLI
ncbi:hypothetical protein L1987_48908 [Smallanthus sonchifolius]|uniref:Uncharacterized protein n=1 Tax=Smallanthus sonchifolius TaxID=185202 RepID=A0ACB9FUC7_9ASTR|nr:hypothetical protein L1987_48908 [Smallanthus sonchifolius]